VPRYGRILLKLSGEVLAGEASFGIDPERVKALAAEVAEVAQSGVQIGLVVGGGNFFRGVAAAAQKMERVLAEAVHALKGAPFVVDIRNCGMAAGIDIEPDVSAPGRRGLEAITRAFHEQDMVIRVGGDTIALAPAFTVSEDEITRMVEGVRAILVQLS